MMISISRPALHRVDGGGANERFEYLVLQRKYQNDVTQ